MINDKYNKKAENKFTYDQGLHIRRPIEKSGFLKTQNPEIRIKSG